MVRCPPTPILSPLLSSFSTVSHLQCQYSFMSHCFELIPQLRVSDSSIHHLLVMLFHIFPGCSRPKSLQCMFIFLCLFFLLMVLYLFSHLSSESVILNSHSLTYNSSYSSIQHILSVHPLCARHRGYGSVHI